MNIKIYEIHPRNLSPYMDGLKWSNTVRRVDMLRFAKNAGGNSIISEIYSYNHMHKFYGAKLCNTEMEISYSDKHSSIVDYSIKLGDQSYGVSVTRLFDYLNLERKVADDKMDRLIKKKINGLYRASENNITDPWDGLILHIIVPNKTISQQIFDYVRYNQSDVIFMVSVIKYPVIYFEKPSHIHHIKQHGLDNLKDIPCLLPKHYGSDSTMEV